MAVPAFLPPDDLIVAPSIGVTTWMEQNARLFDNPGGLSAGATIGLDVLERVGGGWYVGASSRYERGTKPSSPGESAVIDRLVVDAALSYLFSDGILHGPRLQVGRYYSYFSRAAYLGGGTETQSYGGTIYELSYLLIRKGGGVQLSFGFSVGTGRDGSSAPDFGTQIGVGYAFTHVWKPG